MAKLDKETIKDLLTKAKQVLEASSFEVDDLTNKLNQLLQDTDQKPAVLFSLIRIATTQAPASPGLAETLAVLGKEVAMRRIEATLEALT